MSITATRLDRPGAARPPRNRLSLSALIPPTTKLLRRLSSPTSSEASIGRRRSEPDEEQRAARESAPSPASSAPGRERSSFSGITGMTCAGTGNGRALAIVEEPEHIEYCASMHAALEEEGSDAGLLEGMRGQGQMRRSASETDTTFPPAPMPGHGARPISVAPPSYARTQQDAHAQRHIYPQSAPTSPVCIRSQQVWLCSPPRQSLTPVSPRSPHALADSAQSPDASARSPCATLADLTSPLDNIALAARPAGREMAGALAEAQSEMFEVGPPKRCRPVTTRAMSTGRLASEFDEEGRVICLSAHSDRVLVKGQKTDIGSGVGAKSARCPTSWRDCTAGAGASALSRTTSEQGMITRPVRPERFALPSRGRSSVELEGRDLGRGTGKTEMYRAGEGAKRSRASLRGILGF